MYYTQEGPKSCGILILCNKFARSYINKLVVQDSLRLEVGGLVARADGEAGLAQGKGGRDGDEGASEH